AFGFWIPATRCKSLAAVLSSRPSTNWRWRHEGHHLRLRRLRRGPLGYRLQPAHHHGPGATPGRLCGAGPLPGRRTLGCAHFPGGRGADRGLHEGAGMTDYARHWIYTGHAALLGTVAL